MERPSSGINSSEEIKGNLDRPVVGEKNCPKGCGDMSQKKVRFDEFELDFGRFQLSRGGIAIRHTFPLDGEYVIKVRMKRGAGIIGVDKGDQLEVRLDGVRLQLFTLGGVEEMKGITTLGELKSFLRTKLADRTPAGPA